MDSKRPYLATTALLLAMLALQEGILPIQSRASAAAHRPRRLRDRHFTNIVFYMHDVSTGKTPTAVPVAAQNGNLGIPFKFGLTYVFDDKLTAGPDPNSSEVGRGQGIYSLAALTRPDLFITFAVVLHKPAIYNGSTICLSGANRAFLPNGREISVVGGTGVFRFARGYAILSTVSLTGLDAIVKFNVTMIV